MRVIEVCRVGSWVALSVVFSGLWLGNPAVVEAATVPTGLIAGDHYRFVFVTSTIHQARSTDINTYNSIVDALGDTAIESDWKVIGSTKSVDAIVNTSTPITTTGVSIWRLDDVKVADNYADLWDGTILAKISIMQTGEPINNTQTPSLPIGVAWTGTDVGGSAVGHLGYQSPPRISIYADVASTGPQWVNQGIAPNDGKRHLYGMSGVFTVQAAAVPEPSSAILLGVGVICVGWSRFRPKRRQASSTV